MGQEPFFKLWVSSLGCLTAIVIAFGVMIAIIIGIGCIWQSIPVHPVVKGAAVLAGSLLGGSYLMAKWLEE